MVRFVKIGERREREGRGRGRGKTGSVVSGGGVKKASEASVKDSCERSEQ